MVFDKYGNMLIVNSPEESVRHFTTINEMFGVLSEQAIARAKDGSEPLSSPLNLFEILIGNSIESTPLFKAYQN